VKSQQRLLLFEDEKDQKEDERKIREIENKIKEIKNIDIPGPTKHFEWHINYSEIFQEINGFAVVIANPPYISVEKFARTAQQAEWKRRFKTFASRGDIYCFFYERGLGLLREGGVLTFISSNKFQRAGYGKDLREFLASHRIQALMDFCELPVFAAATDPMIVIVNKGAPSEDHQFPVVVIKDEAEFGSLTKSLSTRGTRYKLEQLKADGWSLEGGAGLKIIEKLRAKGIPLCDYPKCCIMAGIKTGYNKAFWISAEAARRFKIEDREACRQFVKPLLIGDDARRWIAKPVTSFLIYTPRGTSEKELGPLKDHIAQWRSRLGQRALDQKWYELQQAQYRYSQTYEKPKIVYPDIALEPRFSLDTLGRYPDMTAFSIPIAEQWLVAMLNSKALWFFLCRTAAVLGDADNRGRVRCKTQYVSRMPIPPLSSDEKSHLTKLAERAAEQAKGSDNDGLRKTEREIDQLVYKLYGLTPEEIAVVEGGGSRV
ncbi:MAG: Eco57I restriction-modification methylase domain-containing protein, partial [Verrucomicrobia bacterium]|nr:Eco57I restriction-modification methylase domain-containing protein [Verrucomicrobiota bacterium]